MSSDTTSARSDTPTGDGLMTRSLHDAAERCSCARRPLECLVVADGRGGVEMRVQIVDYV